MARTHNYKTPIYQLLVVLSSDVWFFVSLDVGVTITAPCLLIKVGGNAHGVL